MEACSNFQKKKTFVAQMSKWPNISRPNNFSEKKCMTPPINVSHLYKACMCTKRSAQSNVQCTSHSNN